MAGSSVFGNIWQRRGTERHGTEQASLGLYAGAQQRGKLFGLTAKCA